MLLPPTQSSALPDIVIVPANVRKDIVQGKDVNLAILLLPIKDRKNITGDRNIQIGEEVFCLKGGRDNRLSRDLTISEFITAFNVYKRVMCTHYPHRRDELDTYIGQIIEISNRFPGFGFYQYHLQFAAKAAEYIERGIRMDWASLDVTLLNTIVAGQKANTCSLCQAYDHTANFCGLNADKPSTKKQQQGQQDACKYFQGEKGCYRKTCAWAHVCAACRSPNHKENDAACPKTKAQ